MKFMDYRKMNIDKNLKNLNILKYTSFDRPRDVYHNASSKGTPATYGNLQHVHVILRR